MINEFEPIPNGEQISSKLRQLVLCVLEDHKRPMAVIEIESWIFNHDKSFYRKIKEKCNDYVRVIMSGSEKFGILKYKSLKSRKGIDKRAIYYGRFDKSYPETDWAPYETSKVNIQKQEAQDNVLSHNIAVAPKRKVIFPMIPFTTDQKQVLPKEIIEILGSYNIMSAV